MSYYVQLIHKRDGSYEGTTTDGRKIVVEPDLLDPDQQVSPESNSDTDWWATQTHQNAIKIYCAVCGDCPQLDDAENLGEGQSCACGCHVIGIALSLPT